MKAGIGVAATCFACAVGVSAVQVQNESARQGATTAQPSFEVASIKENQGSAEPIRFSTQGPLLTITNMPLREIVRASFQLQDFQLVNDPDWIRLTRYDIQAKASQDLPRIPPPPAFNAPGHPAFALLRSLLQDRFALRTHSETRDMPQFRLELVNASGALGPKLIRSGRDCQAILAERAAGARRGEPQATPGTARPCGIVASLGQVVADSQSVEQIVQILTSWAGRPIVDGTGLRGLFNFTFEFAPEDPGSQTTTDKPDLFTALREQLGLRLRAVTSPMPVLVIDEIKRPIAN